MTICQNEWRITMEGDVVCYSTGYYITHDRLDEQDWVSHMSEKNWVDMERFLAVYKAACVLAGIKRVPKGYEGETIAVCDL